MTKRRPERFLKKPYARILIPEEDGSGYTAEILEFPGCFATGRDPKEAIRNLDRAATAWIEAALSEGQEIPEPFDTRDFSGKLILRLPKSLHKQAARMAERDGTSLNQFLMSSVANRVGVEDCWHRLAARPNLNVIIMTPHHGNQVSVTAPALPATSGAGLAATSGEIIRLPLQVVAKVY